MELKHLVSSEQCVDSSFLNELFALAERLETLHADNNLPALLDTKIVATLFFEPSTRTRFSFESAVIRLGGQVITAENAAVASSTVKGESIEDTIRVVSGYADCIVMRHPQSGAAQIAANACPVAFINAGDGSNDHPTQALLDLYTVKKEFGSFDNLTIAFVGDLLYGRTVHALLKFISLFKGVKIYFVSPEQLKLPDEYKESLTKRNINFIEESDFSKVLSEVDVLYMTRVQKERFADLGEYEKVKDAYILKSDMLVAMKPSARILHPLPRVNETEAGVDADPRAAYFRQARNGLYVRMALLTMILNPDAVRVMPGSDPASRNNSLDSGSRPE